jgi:transposase
MHVTQKGPDVLSHYCPVQAFGPGETANTLWSLESRHGSWSNGGGLGQLRRIGVEATGTYGAGLLRYMQNAGVEVLEVTTPDTHDRRKRGKNDDLDAQNAAHAAFARRRTVTPKSRDGMVESLRVLKACRKTAVAARRVALQMIHNTIVCAPDDLRETLRRITRMQLIRTLAAWRPDLIDYRSVVSAYRITLKSLGRRYLELHDEIADLDTMIVAIVDELAPARVARNSIGHGPPRNCS